MTDENNFYIKNKDNDFYNFFEIKAEKIVTAVYMITNFLSDKEPMKWKLREACLSMLSKATVLKGKSNQERSGILVQILNLVSEVLSLLEIAHLSGFISEMNYSVLKNEYLFIKKQIESREEVKSSLGGFTFSESFFNVDCLSISTENVTRKIVPTAKAPESNNLSEGGLNENKKNFIRSSPSYSNQKDIMIPNRVKSDILLGGSKEERERPLQGTNNIKDKRREIISQILKDKKELTIKDIASKITDCSEKTIQRELVSMLGERILKKTGERRWSKYSLF